MVLHREERRDAVGSAAHSRGARAPKREGRGGRARRSNRRAHLLGGGPQTASLAQAIGRGLSECSCPRGDTRIAVVVGPEGGLTEREVGFFLDANPRASLVSLGSSILRTETAGVVAPALTLYELGKLGALDEVRRRQPWLQGQPRRVGRLRFLLDAHGAKSCDAADADLIVVNTCTVTARPRRRRARPFEERCVRTTVRPSSSPGAPPPSTRTPSLQWTRVRVMGKAELASSIDAGAWDLTLRRTGPRFPLGKATAPAWA